MYSAFEISKRFRITPPGGAVSTDGRIDLVMQRGAFGSGEHETTESCLALLETLDLSGARVLDLGSGTGILAIAALRLGAGRAVCVDIEASAVAVAEENCRLNDLEDRVTHRIGTLDDVDTGEFDLILANIYGDILIALAGPLAARAKPGATLLLSGILWEHNFDVRQAYHRQGCRVKANRMLKEFSTILLEKP